MNLAFSKVGTYWMGQKAEKQVDSVCGEIDKISNTIEGGSNWLVNTIKGKTEEQKPLTELLKEHDLPKGIFPRDATYEFDEETRKLNVSIPNICEVEFKDSSVLRFFTTVSGRLENGKLTEIEGMKTKVMIWIKVSGIASDGPKLYVTAGITKTRTRNAYGIVRDAVAVDKF